MGFRNLFLRYRLQRRVYDIYKVSQTYLIIKNVKYFIFTDHIKFLVSSIINLYFNPKAHFTGTRP